MTSDRQLATFFDSKAEAFDGIYSGKRPFGYRVADRVFRKNLPDRLEATLRAVAPVTGKRILDVGCGSGRYSLEFARRGALEIVGVDISTRMLEIAQRLAEQSGVASQCRYIAGSILEVELDSPFDAVIANGFFDYLSDPLRVLRRLRSLTAGTMVATFPCKTAMRVPFRAAWLKAHHCDVYFYSEREVRSLCAESSFDCREVQRIGPIYLLVAQ